MIKTLFNEIKKDTDNMMKQVEELKDIALSGREYFLAQKECEVEDTEDNYDGSREQALDELEADHYKTHGR